MPRTARASIGGICYHVLNRGNARQDVFHEDDDHQRFIELIQEACATCCDPADAHESRQKSRMSPFSPASHENKDCFTPLALTFFDRL